MTALHTPDFTAPDDKPDGYTITLSNGDTVVWHGHIGELNTWNNQAARFLRCTGGTFVNVDHVVVLRPCG